MPNIEMYGFSEEKAAEVANRIQYLFEGKSYTDDYVTTAVWSDVTDHENEAQPFLRLVTTRSMYLFDMIKELRKLGFDIEVMILNRFIPKEK
ncbi:hypothetical protein HQ571_06455 [Candidatus Kuenenbacteria bacterium]|nr:hypothetical protein [Candidatus Kuenenbacteria bacterium]